jgi:menaquinone biosynthesis methyltransferase ubiE
MQEILQNIGFTEVKFERLTFGVCTMYLATK